MKNKLRQLREDAGLSQHQLAIKSGVGKTTISSIEIGQTSNPSVSVAFRLSRALRVSIEEIFYALDDK